MHPRPKTALGRADWASSVSATTFAGRSQRVLGWGALGGWWIAAGLPAVLSPGWCGNHEIAGCMPAKWCFYCWALSAVPPQATGRWQLRWRCTLRQCRVRQPAGGGCGRYQRCQQKHQRYTFAFGRWARKAGDDSLAAGVWGRQRGGPTHWRYTFAFGRPEYERRSGASAFGVWSQPKCGQAHRWNSFALRSAV